MNDDQIKHIVDRFLSWKLPENFRPDAGISFKATFNEHTDHPMKHEPTGTNLLDATQAEAMVRYMVDGLPTTPPLAFHNLSEAERHRLFASLEPLRQFLGSPGDWGYGSRLGNLTLEVIAIHRELMR